MRRRPRSLALAGSLALALTLSVTSTTGSAAPTQPADRAESGPPKNATAVGRGGAVTWVDPNASRVGLRVLKNGGNAVDAAVATAAALGVAEPYSAGVGGGGYFVYYDAKSGRVHTIDGRETAPRRMPSDAFIDPETGLPSRRSHRTWSPAACPWACRAPPPPGPPPWTGGARRDCARCSRRRPDWPSAGSWSTRPSVGRRRTSRRGLRRSPRAGRYSCTAACPRWAGAWRTQRWPAPTARSRRTRSSSTAGSSPAGSSTPSDGHGHRRHHAAGAAGVHEPSRPA